MKKQSNLSQLMGYAGNHRYLTYLSLLLSAVSAVLALFPFVFLFLIIREVIEVSPNYAQAANMVCYGWMAVLFAVVSILIYMTGLICSHLSAFRIAGNIRKALMAHIAVLPLGLVGEMGSGKSAVLSTRAARLLKPIWPTSFPTWRRRSPRQSA